VKNSNSYNEVLKKMGYTSTSGWVQTEIKKKIKNLGIDNSHFSRALMVTKKKELSEIFIEDSKCGQRTLRTYVIKLNLIEYKCIECGQLPIYNEKELVLQLDHINGINNDNRLENLRFLCPNCHSQTKTFGIKNKKKTTQINKEINCKLCNNSITKYSKSGLCKICKNKLSRKVDRPLREELLILITSKSFLDIGKQYGVSDNTIRKWCENYKLPYKLEEISKLKENISGDNSPN